METANNMNKLKALLFSLAIASTITLSGCSSWIFRIDVPQGNFLDEQDVEKLRVGMSKEQVIFVLGNPVLRDSFDKDIFYYVYEMKRGMKSRGEDFKKDLIIEFQNDKLAKVSGDFEVSEDFDKPLE